MSLLRCGVVGVALSLGLLLTLDGCSPHGPQKDAGVDAGPVDAGPPPLPPLQFTLHFESDGGVQDGVLKLGEPLFVAPAEHIRVEANRQLRNYRVRLFDEADRALESDDASEDAATGTRYDIALKAPLKPGRKYAFVVDAQSGAMLSDAQGNAITEQRFELQTTGERVRDRPAAPARPTKRRKHRRGRG